MAEFPALPLWTDAYLGDCHHLSDAEHGRYLLLLIEMWRAPNQRLPNDDRWLARKFRRSVKEVREEIRPLIKEFCQCDGNWITQRRLSREFGYVKKSSALQSARAKSRWNKEKRTSRGNATRGIDPALPPHPHPHPHPDSPPNGGGDSPGLPGIADGDGDRSPDWQLEEAVRRWTALAEKHDLSPKNPSLGPDRKANLRKRLKEAGGLPGWDHALSQVEESSFLLGGGDNGWKADFDFMLRRSRFRKLMEGGYTDGRGRGRNGAGPTSGNSDEAARRRAGLAAAVGGRLAGGSPDAKNAGGD